MVLPAKDIPTGNLKNRPNKLKRTAEDQRCSQNRNLRSADTDYRYSHQPIDHGPERNYPGRHRRAFEAQNKVVDAGGIEAGLNRIRIESTGNFYSLDDIRNLTIVSRTGEHFRLSDVAEIKESYQTPPANLMRIDGKPAVGIAISTIPTGNVVNMAELIKEQTDHFTNTLPEGFSLDLYLDQGYESAVANQGFIINLIVSVLTVVAILLFFIGFKNGLLIGSGLIFSIFATLIVMFANGIALQRMSLAAIIIAMGMLVDNAIVVSDSALVNMQRWLMRKRVAILRACSSTALRF